MKLRMLEPFFLNILMVEIGKISHRNRGKFVKYGKKSFSASFFAAILKIPGSAPVLNKKSLLGSCFLGEHSNYRESTIRQVKCKGSQNCNFNFFASDVIFFCTKISQTLKSLKETTKFLLIIFENMREI